MSRFLAVVLTVRSEVTSYRPDVVFHKIAPSLPSITSVLDGLKNNENTKLHVIIRLGLEFHFAPKNVIVNTGVFYCQHFRQHKMLPQ